MTYGQIVIVIGLGLFCYGLLSAIVLSAIEMVTKRLVMKEVIAMACTSAFGIILLLTQAHS